MGEVLSLSRKIFKVDPRLREALMDLQQFVEHVIDNPADIALRGGVYKEIERADLFTVTLDNLEVGYKIIRHSQDPLTEIRRVFVKLHDYKFDELTDDDKDPLMKAILDVFMDMRTLVPEVEAPDANTVIFTQMCTRRGLLDGEVIQ